MLNQTPYNPDMDKLRIRAIREQIDDDSYPVDPRQIADKIIDLEIALANPE
jgi:anti-sigma28 factor (negative regulator of flagellin synthesis)